MVTLHSVELRVDQYNEHIKFTFKKEINNSGEIDSLIIYVNWVLKVWKSARRYLSPKTSVNANFR